MAPEYRRSSHTIFRIELHLVWVTKYRYPVITDDVAERTRELLRRIATEEKVEIISGSVSPDHIHMLVSLDPSVSISTLMRQLKGTSSRILQMEFPHLKKRYWGQHLWARGYFAVSSGNVTTAMIEEYIQHHFTHTTKNDDPFQIEKP
jgi:putative transposase